MPVVGRAEVLVAPSFTGAQKSISKGLNSPSINNAAKKSGSGIGSRMASGIGAVFAGGALLSIAQKAGSLITSNIGAAINQSDATDKFKQTLNFAGQSTKQIATLTKSAQSYADQTVYSLSDIQNVTAQLTANGVKGADGLAKSLGNLNAVAGGNSETFKSVSMALTQTVGAGKLTTENWNQIADAIPGASGILQKQMKKNGAFVGDFREAMAKGEITADEFNKAISQTGGTKAAKEAATSTKTIEGAWGNLQASITGGLAKIVSALKPTITTVINGLAPAFDKGFGVASKVIGSALKVAKLFFTVVNGGDTEKLKKALPEDLFNKVTVLAVKAGGAIGTLKGAFSTAGAAVKNLDFSKLSQFSPLLSVLKGAAPALLSVSGSFVDLGKALGGALAAVLPVVVPLLITLASTLGNALIAILPTVVDLVAGAATQMAKLVGWLAQSNTALAIIGGLLAGFGAYMLIVKGIAIATQVWGVATKVAAGFQWLLNAAMSANPIGLVVAAIVALAAGLIIAYKKSATFRKIVNGALQGVKTVALAVFNWFTKKLVPFFTKTLPGAFQSAVSWVKKNWPKILIFLTGPIGLAVAGIVKHKDKIVGAFKSLKNWVGGTWKKGWAGAKSWIADSVGKGKDLVATHLGKGSGVRQKFDSLKTWTGNTWKQGWKSAESWIKDPVGNAKKSISTILGSKGVRAVFNGLDAFGQKIFGPKWAGMKAKLTVPIDNAKAYFKKIFAKGAKGGFLTLFSDMVKNAGAIFGRIKDVLVAPIKAAINVINKGLIKGGINWILGKLGVDKKHQVPWIPMPGFLTGGSTGNKPRNAIAGVVHGQEHVVTADEVASTPGGHRTWSNLRALAKKGLLPGYKFGGAVFGGSGGGLTNFDGGTFTPKFAAVVKKLASIVNGFQLYQGGWNAGGVAASGGTHDKDALDFGPATRTNETKARSVGLGAWLRNVATGWTQTLAHIHAIPSPSNGDGSSGARAQWQNYLDGENGLTNHGKDTGSRQYVKGGKGIVGGFVDFLKGLSPFDWLKKKAAGLVGSNIGGGIFGSGLMSKMPGLIIDRAKDWIGTNLFGSSSPAGSGVERWRGVITQALKANGLPTSAEMVSAWLKQVKTESGGNEKAVQGIQDVNSFNGSGGAKGLLQTIQSTFNAYKFPGHGNIFTGLDNALAAINYEKHKKNGSVAGILADIGHGHGYDSGGLLMPGYTLAYNGTSKPEPVFTDDQWNKLGKRGGGDNVLNVENLGFDPRKIFTEWERQQRRAMAQNNLAAIS